MRDRETRNIPSGENLRQGHVLIFLKRNETSNATSRRNILVGRGPLNVVAFVSTAMGPVFYEEEGGPQKNPMLQGPGPLSRK